MVPSIGHGHTILALCGQKIRSLAHPFTIHRRHAARHQLDGSPNAVGDISVLVVFPLRLSSSSFSSLSPSPLHVFSLGAFCTLPCCRRPPSTTLLCTSTFPASTKKLRYNSSPCFVHSRCCFTKPRTSRRIHKLLLHTKSRISGRVHNGCCFTQNHALADVFHKGCFTKITH